MSAAVVQARHLQKVYIEWCVKAAEIILASRIDDPGVAAESPLPTSASFNLKVPEIFDVRSEMVARPEFFQLKTQRSFQVEIYMGVPPEAGEDEVGQLLERWTFTFFPAHPEPSVPDRCNQTLVRKLSVTLRSLLCFTRLLPAYALCRGSRGANPRHWRFRVEAWPPTSRATLAQELSTQDFVSLQSSVGTLRLSVSQRKDLKSMPASGPFRSTVAIGSQLDPIEVEESYFTSSIDVPPPPEASTSLGLLGKIAEEPEVKASDTHNPRLEPHHYDSIEQPPLSNAPSGVLHEPVSVRGDRMSRPCISSEDTMSSTVSTSSKIHSVPDHAVALGATPPLASAVRSSPQPGLITLGPHHRGDSACSSRSVTPQTTPKLGPTPEPLAPPSVEQRSRPNPLVGATLGTPRAGLTHAVGVTCGMANESRASTAAPSSPGVAAHMGSQPPSSATDVAALSSPSRPGEVDDLSGIWMSCPPEWGARRRSLSLGTASRGSGAYSRSLSPEDAARSAVVAGFAAVAAEAPAMGSRRSIDGCRCSVSPDGARLSAQKGLAPLGEPHSEIRMFGMSDDEDEDIASDDEDDMERNVVASTIQEGNGAAFATICLDPDHLGLTRLNPLDEQPSRRPSPASDGSGASPRRLSPLIAQLNPFVPAPPPSLDLPPPATAWGAEEPRPATPEPVDSQGPAGGMEVRHLLAEMGDLVCRLQQWQGLTITAQEASPDECLERLAHFREVAGSTELRCHS
mmetsp:Transcript_108039/g.301266  ORF Transcript_108039/g.301266 Transcript_108039/m.301266 type:complete len:740 (-) Transcript_108039:51-2270(-)